MEGKKRKREADYPRIIYHTSNRTFDRLFKGTTLILRHSKCRLSAFVSEDSLEETREVIRRKLSLDAEADIQLAQLRQGAAVDLEDGTSFLIVLIHDVHPLPFRGRF
jgi:hypothetical protein